MAQASQTHTCSLRPFLLCTIAFLLPPRRVELRYLTHFCPQKLKVVPVEKKTYGKFHSGDSYIVLQVSHWQAGPMGEGMCVLYRNLSLLPQHCSCGLSIVKVCVYCAWYCTMTRTVFSRGQMVAMAVTEIGSREMVGSRQAFPVSCRSQHKKETNC